MSLDDALVTLSQVADLIEQAGKLPVPVPYLAEATLFAADALRMFVTLVSLGHPPHESLALLRRAINDDPELNRVRAEREDALQRALKGG